jgi:hypothetical protein
MRVIHEDGRAGTTPSVDHWRFPNKQLVTFDDEPALWGKPWKSQLRPLGPIEDELRRRGSEIPFSEMSSLVVFDAVWGASDRLFGDGPLPSDAVTWRAECLSEAIEACERIYQQTGVVL